MTPDFETAIFALRVGLTGLLYLIVLMAALLAWQGVVRTSRRQRSVPPEQPPSASLVVADGGSSGLMVGSRLPLTVQASIGRTASNRIALADPAVSGQHARIVRQSNGWWLSDQGSSNGTLVNGLRISHPVRLHTGDLIQIGSTVLRFEE